MLLCGYYGEHNLGDDALLEALLQQLPDGWQPLVTARDQELVRDRFGVATTDRRSLAGVLAALRRCDALVLGGGSLLQDATSFSSLLYYAALILAARAQGKPVGLWGQGLGPLRRRRSRALVRLLLPLATAISWRDQASADLAAELSGPEAASTVGSDPVWGIPGCPWQGQGGPLVVCWRPTPLLQGQAWTPYLQALERLARDHDREVHWLPFHGDQDRGLLADLRAGRLISEELQQRSRLLEATDPSAAQVIFGRAGLVVAMRLHALILAALAGAPTAALSYDPKVAAAAASIGCCWEDLGAPPPADLLSRWQRALDQPADAERIASLVRGADRHRQVLDRLLASGR